MAATKVCTKCGETRALEDFKRDRTRRDGRGSWCRSCARKAACQHRRVYHAANRSDLLEGMRAYHQANRERIHARQRAWRDANPERIRALGAVRYARKRAATIGAPFTEDDIIERCGGLCYLCGDPVDIFDRSDWHLDHRVPLARGGEHSADNLQLAHARCNVAKGARLESEHPTPLLAALAAT